MSRNLLQHMLLIGFTLAAHEALGELAVERLTCEYRIDPLGIDILEPRLSWIVDSGEQSAKQIAYQLLVSSSSEKLAADEGDLSDSGTRSSSKTVVLPYEGKPLRSRFKCFWRVRVWYQDEKVSEWSRPSKWTMGLLDDTDWPADFICYRDETLIYTKREPLFLPPARQYRKEFATGPRKIRRATIYDSALGICELHLNGKKVGDAFLAPGWTDYLAGGLLLSEGTEAIGRYTYGKTHSLIAQLEIEYDDGSGEAVSTSPSWKTTGEGPIQEVDIFIGEMYDARREMPRWLAPGFDDSAWEEAIPAEENGHPMATFP